MVTCPNWRCERRKMLKKLSSKKIGMRTRDKTDLQALFDEVAMPAELIQSIFDESYLQWPVRLYSRHKALANTRGYSIGVTCSILAFLRRSVYVCRNKNIAGLWFAYTRIAISLDGS